MNELLEERLFGMLVRYTSEPTARGILQRARRGQTAERGNAKEYFDMVMFGAKLFVEDTRHGDLTESLQQVCFGSIRVEQPRSSPHEIEIQDEHSSRRARLLVRRLVRTAGGRELTAVRAATALSELTRNALMYAGGGSVRVEMNDRDRKLRVIVRDDGPGIGDLDRILAGTYRSKTGLGRGLLGVRKLADHFHVQTSESGTTVCFDMFV
ncbi:MAG: ATP-binding protein [Nannocystaceae bacterium]|nr:ATP-binding protein [Nannocystaceae bacterium]